MARFMSFLHSLDTNMLQEFATFFEGPQVRAASVIWERGFWSGGVDQALSNQHSAGRSAVRIVFLRFANFAAVLCGLRG
jgi:hypothetical protein